jgi:hypothetical protein
MCLAIYKPAGVTIPKQNLENGFNQNDDGAGMAWFEDGKVKILKGLFSFKRFYEEYIKRERFQMLIHFRWATHGTKNALNCHPFVFGNNRYALIHNGMLPIKCMDKNLSDTGNFTKLVMEPMMAQGGASLKKPAFRFLIEQAIGRGNKLAIMGPDGEVVIYNEEEGSWVGEEKGKKVWYSNDGYKFSQSEMEEMMAEYEAAQQAERVSRGGESAIGGVGFHAGTAAGGSCNGKGKLDAPPVIDLTAPNKTAKDSAEVFILNGKNVTMKDTQALPTISQGPIFGPKLELEIGHVMSELTMTREQAIEWLDLDDSVCEGYVG